jgi:hypothetical protein
MWESLRVNGWQAGYGEKGKREELLEGRMLGGTML